MIKRGVSSLVFLLVLFFSFFYFVSADGIDSLIGQGLNNRIIDSNETNITQPQICLEGDLECEKSNLLLEANNFCEDDFACLEQIGSQINSSFSNETVFDQGNYPLATTENAQSPSVIVSNLRNVKQQNISTEFKAEVKKYSSGRKLSVSNYEQSWWERFINYLNNLRSSITGNVIKTESYDNLDLPSLPESPGSVEEVAKPIISLGKFKIFNFLTGNAIIGIPDWSFDGTDTKNGNFIWNASFTEQQAGLQHFELKIDINFSKEDSNGKTPVNGIIAQKAYYLDENKGRWEAFNFTGTEIWSTDASIGKNVFTGWLRAGTNNQPIPSASITLENHTKSDYSVFLTYSCLKFFETTWECNKGKWVVHVVETGDVDYHSTIGESPVMGYKEVKDLNISDIPSILKQFNVTLFEFQPVLNDIFITEGKNNITTEEGKIETLDFYVKNFGNRNLTGIRFELDIGERSLAEVVSVDLPSNLSINQTKKGTISILFKQNHSQKITLWAKPSQAEVDTSDNMAIYNIVVGKKPTLADVPNRTAYTGNTGEMIVNWSKVETFNQSKFGNSSLEVLSGVDKVRTIWGGYWNGTSINPTMQVFVKGMLTEEALFATPFLSSFSMGGKLLTGDREIVEYKVRFTNSKTGVYYETPVMQDSYIYHYNPKQLIPDFQWCTDYIIDIELTGQNHETVDIIHPDLLNVCNRRNIDINNGFITERLLKQDGNYVVVKPILKEDLLLSKDVRYFVEFKDTNNRTYRTPVLNLNNGVQIVSVSDIFGNRGISYGGSGETFAGKAVLMDSLVFKDLEQKAFGFKYRVVGRDCKKTYNKTDLYGFAGMVGFDNWQSLSSDKAESNKFLCYDDKYYYCGQQYYYNQLGYKNISVNTTNNQKVGSWSCINSAWIRDDGNYVGVTINASLATKRTESFSVNSTIVNCSSNLSVYVKQGAPFVSEEFILNGTVSRIVSLLDQNISELLAGNSFKNYSNYYFVCSGNITLYNKTTSQQRTVYLDGKSSFNKSLQFMWNGWDLGINILFNFNTNLIMKDELIRAYVPKGFTSTLSNGNLTYYEGYYDYSSQRYVPNYYSGSSFNSFISRTPQDSADQIYFAFPNYMDGNLQQVIRSETLYRGVLFDLTDNKEAFVYVGNGSDCYSDINIFSNCYNGQNDFAHRFSKLAGGKMSNGHYYELRISIDSKNSYLFAPIEPVRLFYVDGWNFILNNQLLYSRFFGLQNYPDSVVSYLQNGDVPTVQIKSVSANTYFDSCLGHYKKFENINQRYINLIDNCTYPDSAFISYEGSEKPVFTSMSMTVYPVKSLKDLETKRTQFNCKIGRFDGICLRDNYGYNFVYFDERTNLVYNIDLRANDGRFIKQYRDSSNNGTVGNPFDALIYDILTQIDRKPIRDFDLSYVYEKPVYNEMISWALYPNSNANIGFYLKKNASILDYGLWSSYPTYAFYDEAMNFIGFEDYPYNASRYDPFSIRINPVTAESLVGVFGKFFENRNLSTGHYFINVKGKLSFAYWQNYFVNDFIWSLDYPKWFFKDMNWGKYVNIYKNNSQFVFYEPSFIKTASSSTGNKVFNFILNPRNWTVQPEYTQEQMDRDIKYYNCDDCDWSTTNYLSSNVSNRKGNVSVWLLPSVINTSGGVMRQFTLGVQQRNDIYEWFSYAPKNCNNAHDTTEFRDVVCSSYTSCDDSYLHMVYNYSYLRDKYYNSTTGWKIGTDYNSYSSITNTYDCYPDTPVKFVFKCSWANIDELQTYDLSMTQTFINRTKTQVNNLPSETIKEMRDGFLYPVLRAHLAELKPTPILNTTYGTFTDAELRKSFCV